MGDDSPSSSKIQKTKNLKIQKRRIEKMKKVTRNNLIKLVDMMKQYQEQYPTEVSLSIYYILL